MEANRWLFITRRAYQPRPAGNYWPEGWRTDRYVPVRTNTPENRPSPPVRLIDDHGSRRRLPRSGLRFSMRLRVRCRPGKSPLPAVINWCAKWIITVSAP